MTTRTLSAWQSEDGRWTARFALVPDSLDAELTISVRETCACKRDITLEELKSGLKNLGADELFSASHHGLAGTSWEDFLDCLNKSMAEYDIDDCIDKAHFLAQVAVESDSLRITTASGSRTCKPWPRRLASPPVTTFERGVRRVRVRRQRTEPDTEWPTVLAKSARGP